MFPRTFVLSTFIALPLLAAASVVPRTGVNQCNTGSLECCKETKNASESQLLSGLGLGHVTGLVGEGCSPLTIVGTGGANPCTAQPVCCTNNNFNGVVALGCTPITLVL